MLPSILSSLVSFRPRHAGKDLSCFSHPHERRQMITPLLRLREAIQLRFYLLHFLPMNHPNTIVLLVQIHGVLGVNPLLDLPGKLGVTQRNPAELRRASIWVCMFGNILLVSPLEANVGLVPQNACGTHDCG
ncbi:hypothetical protein BJX68DRAFT_248301 [Aspergillus pseudodeflectus]|uniref:Uncharacterized protein n=1 Tax=Aspergillus pseudodeflectus TaxID=176178 RepID=A0ABR4JH08_9EURO